MTTEERIKELREWPFRSDALDELAKMVIEREQKLATALFALATMRRDSKSPDFVKVYCALIEDQLLCK